MAEQKFIYHMYRLSKIVPPKREILRNINLSLVKQGVAAYLPYGEAEGSIISRPDFEIAEQNAAGGGRGMWQEPFWQTYYTAKKSSGNSITFNTAHRAQCTDAPM